MKKTKESILERALELFNDKGVEYGGMRELAGLLDMRVSNITYYFATKDDLVKEFMDQLAGLNSQTTNKYDGSSLRNFLTMYNELFGNQYKYRCLLMSFVHLITHHPWLADEYKIIEKKRKQRLDVVITQLISSGYIRKNTTEAQSALMIAHISFISRFWILEARVSYPEKAIESVIKHYLTLLSEVFQPYATAKGKKDIDAFFK